MIAAYNYWSIAVRGALNDDEAENTVHHGGCCGGVRSTAGTTAVDGAERVFAVQDVFAGGKPCLFDGATQQWERIVADVAEGQGNVWLTVWERQENLYTDILLADGQAYYRFRMNGPPAPAFRHRSGGSQNEPDGESAYWRDGWYYDPATGSLTAVAQADLPFGADLQDLLNRVSEALRDDADRSSLSATQQLSKSLLLRTFVKSDWPIELHAAVLPAPGGAEQAGTVYCALSPNREKTLRSISFYDGESQMEIGAVLDDEEGAERLRLEIGAFTGGA